MHGVVQSGASIIVSETAIFWIKLCRAWLYVRAGEAKNFDPSIVSMDMAR